MHRPVAGRCPSGVLPAATLSGQSRLEAWAQSCARGFCAVISSSGPVKTNQRSILAHRRGRFLPDTCSSAFVSNASDTIDACRPHVLSSTLRMPLSTSLVQSLRSMAMPQTFALRVINPMYDGTTSAIESLPCEISDGGNGVCMLHVRSMIAADQKTGF